jgi:hypothetical protein
MIIFANSSKWVGMVLLTGYLNCKEQFVDHLCKIINVKAKERMDIKYLFSKCWRLAFAQGLIFFKEFSQVVIYKMFGSCSTTYMPIKYYTTRQSRNQEDNIYKEVVDEFARTIIQCTKYNTFFIDKAYGSSPTKKDFHLQTVKKCGNVSFILTTM